MRDCDRGSYEYLKMFQKEEYRTCSSSNNKGYILYQGKGVSNLKENIIHLAKYTQHRPFPGISSMSTTALLAGSAAVGGIRPPRGNIEFKPAMPIIPPPKPVAVRLAKADSVVMVSCTWFIRSSFSITKTG